MASEKREQSAASNRDPLAKDKDRFPDAYQELRARARRILGSSNGTGPLQATALVHEAWIKLSTGKASDWGDDNHFLNSVMRTMRCVLIDEIRRGKRIKRGGAWTEIPLHSDLVADPRALGRTLEVEDALKELAELSADVARIVELRFFTGFNDEEISSALDMNAARVRSAWRMARAWLRVRLDGNAA